MIVILGYLAFLGCVLVAVLVSRALAPWLGGWSLAPGFAAGTTLGLIVFRIAFRRGARRSESPTALWISRRGLASGYHQTDKLTPDGVLAGFDHDDFTPGFRQTYRVQLAPEVVADVFARLGSAELAELAGSFADPQLADGFTLQVTWRLNGVEKSVWFSNTFHPLLSPLVEDVWRHAPAELGRQLPDFRRSP